MSTTYTSEPITTNGPASNTSHQSTSSPDVAFKPWQAIRVFEVRLPGLAQLAAVHIARRSDRNGEAKGITVERIAELLHCSEGTARRAIKEVVSSGLLAARRTRDGYVYKWSLAAYNLPAVGQRSENR